MRKKLSAAERETRGEAGFVKDRPRRDARRRELTAATLAELDRSARICASANARRAAMRLALSDRAARRKDRLAKRRQLWAQYQEAVAPLLAWFEQVEGR